MRSFQCLHVGLMLWAAVTMLPTSHGVHLHRMLEDKELSYPCRLILLESEEGEVWFCELDPRDNDGVPGILLPTQGMQLTQSQEENDVVSGGTLAFASGLRVQDDTIIFPTAPQLSPTAGKFITPNTQGEKKVLMVRVSTSDTEPTLSAARLSDEVFGTDGDPFNMVTQFDACSYGKFTVQPFLGELSGNAVTNGLYETYIDVESLDVSTYQLQNLVTTQLATDLGYSWREDADIDFVMYCFPLTTFTAYAYFNFHLSVYSNSWCRYPSGHMHEIGHNINLHHSNENGFEYTDQTGLMGYSYLIDDYPPMCFNGAKSWFLHWYIDREEEIDLNDPDTTWTGDLVGVDDYEKAESETVILRIQDTSYINYYIMFNHADGINIGTQEGRNQVMVTSAPLTGRTRSNLVAKLSANQEFTIEGQGSHDKTATIKVNSIDVNSGLSTASIEVTTIEPPKEECLHAFLWNADDDELVGEIERGATDFFCFEGWEFNIEAYLDCRDDVDHIEFVTTGPGIDQRKVDARAPYFAFGGRYGAVLGLDAEFPSRYDVEITVVFQDGTDYQEDFSFVFEKTCHPPPERCFSAYLWNADDEVRVGEISTRGESFFCTEGWEYSVEVDLDCRDDIEHIKFITAGPESTDTHRDFTAPYFAFRGNYDSFSGQDAIAGVYEVDVTVAFDYNQKYTTSLNFELGDCDPKPEDCFEAFLWNVNDNVSVANIPPSQAGVSFCRGEWDYSIEVKFDCRRDISHVEFVTTGPTSRVRRNDFNAPYFAFGGSYNTQNGREAELGSYEVEVTVVFDEDEEYHTTLGFEIEDCV